MEQLAGAMDDATVEGGAFAPILGAPPEGSVRSIFFYNADIELETEVGLHLFEPRYRRMVQRAMKSPARSRQLIFLPNFRRYIGAHGDVGALAHITRYRPIRDGSGGLPRAEVSLRFTARVLVLFHWEEPGTQGLHECTFSVLPPTPPPSALLERLLDCLQQSTDRCYRVATMKGFLHVYAQPTDAFDTTNVVGTLSDGDVVVALENTAGWVRHELGWSISRIRGDRFVWLVPIAPIVLPAGVTVVPSSKNARAQHVVLHAPSKEAARNARALLDELAEGTSACTVEAIMPVVRG